MVRPGQGRGPNYTGSRTLPSSQRKKRRRTTRPQAELNLRQYSEYLEMDIPVTIGKYKVTGMTDSGARGLSCITTSLARKIHRWLDPFTVIKKLNRLSYCVRIKKYGKLRPDKIHIHFMKPYNKRPSHLSRLICLVVSHWFVKTSLYVVGSVLKLLGVLD